MHHTFQIFIGDGNCSELLRTIEVKGTLKYAYDYIAGYVQACKDKNQITGPHNNVIELSDSECDMLFVDYVDPLEGWRRITA